MQGGIAVAIQESEPKPTVTGSPEYYRERARAMLKLADEAGSEETRVSLVLLAATWTELAKQIENPGW
ncbi:MAG TPA: hypothetical protein VFI23_07585 [Rhizomicrobium sp.]|nr:hypothetical protein [Rhizomicrobium sp.]